MIILNPQANLVAAPTIASEIVADAYDLAGAPDGGAASFAEQIIEYSGRSCYKSYGRKNESTAQTRDYIKNLMSQKHYSVLEHASFTFAITCSRAASHEIVRHRHFSFSQESTRYVVYREPVIVNPPGFHPSELNVALIQRIHDEYLEMFNRKVSQGMKRKDAASDARYYLPHMTATNIIVTGNVRSWIEFIDKRDHEAADKEIRMIAQQVADKLGEVIPSVMENRELWSGEASQNAPK